MHFCYKSDLIMYHCNYVLCNLLTVLIRLKGHIKQVACMLVVLYILEMYSSGELRATLGNYFIMQ